MQAPTKNRSQAKRLVAHLLEVGSISPAEARQVYGIERLAARIHQLRLLSIGLDVWLEVVPRVDREGKRYSRYQWHSDINQRAKNNIARECGVS